MDIKEITISEYKKFVGDKTNGFVFGTDTYLNTLKLLGYSFKYYGFYSNEKLSSIIPIQCKRIKFTNKYYYNVPNGIIGEYNEDFLNEVINILKKNSLIIKYSSNQLLNDSYRSLDKTIEIDLSKDLESIFSSFSKSFRNLVRKGIKEEVKVSISNDLTYLDLFLDYYYSMMDSKNAETLDRVFLKSVITNLINDNLGFFAVAEYEDIVYNIAFVSTIGRRARYLYGSSIRTNKKIPPIGQVLHFKIIEYLKNEDYLIYDLGGIPEHTPESTESIYGVYRFKKGFGGEEVVTNYNYVYYKYKILKKVFKG